MLSLLSFALSYNDGILSSVRVRTSSPP